MDIIKLNARLRTGIGKTYIKQTRQQGWIPAIYYGHDRKTKAIEINAREFAALVRAKKTTHLIDLGLPEEEGESAAIIKEIQRHTLKHDQFIHIDFQHVKMDEEITVKCPLELTGIPIGVLEENGVLGHPVQNITIECMPVNIPDKISVDVSHLRVGESIHIKDIQVPNAVIKDSPEEVIAVVTHPTKVEVAVPATEEEKVEGEAEGEGEEKAEGSAETKDKTKDKAKDKAETK